MDACLRVEGVNGLVQALRQDWARLGTMSCIERAAKAADANAAAKSLPHVPATLSLSERLKRTTKTVV